EGDAVASVVSQAHSAAWLLENGPRELESLFRAVVYHPSVPILIADDDRRCLEASAGAAKLLGVPRAGLIGRKMDEFADPHSRPRISDFWGTFLGKGEQAGTFRLAGPDGN